MTETQPATDSAPVLSIVIPLLNEEDVLEETYRVLKTEMDALDESYELIFVDDGSTDRSRAILEAKAKTDCAVRAVILSRNFGHEMATTAGLAHARGQAAVVIDADLQDPPELIREFVKEWRAGYHVVYGIREERRGESLLKRFTSFLFYRLVRSIADVRIPKDVGDFRLMDRRVIDVYAQFREEPRFFRGLITWVGYRQKGVRFVRRERVAGTTKYRYNRLIKLAFDTITAFSTFPALGITLLAWGFAALSVGFSTVMIALWLTNCVTMTGWMWAGLGFLGLWNVQFLCLAVLGEYIVRTHRHTQQRPLFLVETVLEQETHT